MKIFTLSLLTLTIASSALADELDDMFSDDAFADIDIEQAPINDSPLSLTHQLSFQGIVNINSDKANAVEELYSGVTRLSAGYRPTVTYKPTASLSFTADVEFTTDSIFWLRQDDAWSDKDIDARQYQMNIKQLTAQVRADQWQASTGFQTVTLGLTDALSVANVLYAQDLSVPGTKDMDDTLIPAWTSLVSGSLGPVRIKTGAVHTHEINLMPVAGSDFDTGMAATLDAAGLKLESEELALENMSWFASLSGVVGPLDWQINGVSQLVHTPSVEVGIVSMGPPPVIMPVALHYPRVNIGSLSLSYVTGPLLWKLEGAYTEGLMAQVSNGMMPGELMSYQKANATVGFDFNHSTLGRLIAEIQFGQILDYDRYNFLDTDETTAQWALMYNQTFLRDRLIISGQLIGFDVNLDGGRMQGLGLEYELSDQLTARLRLLDYVGGDFQMLAGADDRDRVIIGLDYSF